MIVAQELLPKPKEVRDLLLDLLGRDVTLAPADAWAPLPNEGALVAELVDDHNGLIAITVADLRFSAFVGCAIGLLPAGGARDMVDEGRLSGPVVENVYEVLNVASALFTKEGAPPVRIGALHGPGGPLPTDIGLIVRRLTGRVDVSVEVAGYGTGKIAFVAA